MKAKIECPYCAVLLLVQVYSVEAFVAEVHMELEPKQAGVPKPLLYSSHKLLRRAARPHFGLLGDPGASDFVPSSDLVKRAEPEDVYVAIRH